jgi:hypothetical protein
MYQQRTQAEMNEEVVKKNQKYSIGMGGSKKEFDSEAHGLVIIYFLFQ